MIDCLQFEGVLARFTLRHWSRVDARSFDVDDSRDAWVRGVDEQQLASMLARTLDQHGLRQLRAFMFALDGHAATLAAADDGAELLRHVARRIAAGELILTREPVEPQASETIDTYASERSYRPVVNEIDDGTGLFERSRQTSTEESAQLAQRRQAEILSTAADQGSPFCEVCAGVESRFVGEHEEVELLDTQARQAQTLVEASESGTAFCEVCAACLQDEAPPQTEAPTPLATQGKQAQTLTAASENGTPFCAKCQH